MTADRPAPVDPGVLHALAADVGRETAAGVIERFVAMLEVRLTRIRTAPDPDELRVAALSLACSASMLGAEPLARSARSLRMSDLAPDLDDGPREERALSRLDALARCTADELGRVHAPCAS